jgi:phosphorylcholine metabolism protein LicD
MGRGKWRQFRFYKGVHPTDTPVQVIKDKYTEKYAVALHPQIEDYGYKVKSS